MHGVDDRRLRHVSAALGLLAAAGLAIAIMALPLGSYISEAGVAGMPHFVLYRFSLLAVGVAAAALAAGLLRFCALAATALFVAAPAVIGSAAVACTPGCPLPPYEATTGRDLAHAAASIVGVGFCALAMLALARCAHGRLRRLSWLGVAIAWPLLLATAVSILALGRGLSTGLLERAAIAACLAWIVAASLTPRDPAPLPR